MYTYSTTRHLHCTSRKVLAVSCPQELLASHLYSPVSFLLMFVSSRVSPTVRFPVLSAVHVTERTGLPETLQVRVLLSPSVTVMFSSGYTPAGTVKQITKGN